MIINHNMNAMNAHRNMMGNIAKAGKSMEKLSSGLRINRAGDDAAGLAISEKMRGQIRGLDQAGRNAQDGISMIQTAEGALNETHSILQRMKELSTQSANDTNTTVDRKEIQKEMNQLTSEINRIGNNTEFNTQKLLNGEKAQGSAIGSVGSVTNVDAVAPTPAGSGAITPSATTAGAAATTGTKGTTTFTIDTALADGETIAVGGKTVTTYADAAARTTAGDTAYGILATDDAATQATAIRAMTFDAGVTATGSGADITLTQDVAGTGDATAAVLTGGTGAITQGTTTAGVAATAGTAGTTTVKIDTALSDGDQLTVGGKTITAYKDQAAKDAANAGAGDAYGVLATDTAEDQATAIRAMTFDTGVTATGSGAEITLTQDVAGTGDATAATIVNTSSTPGTAGSTTFTIDTALADGESVEIGGKTITSYADAAARSAANGGAGDAYGVLATDTAADQATAIRAMTFDTGVSATGTGATITLTQDTAGTGDVTAPSDITSTNDGRATLQIGANQGQGFTVEITDMRASALGISGTAGEAATGVTDAKFAVAANTDKLTDASMSGDEYSLDVTTNESSSAAIKVIDNAIEKVSSERSKLGAYQNRLEHTINNLGTASENLTAAESRVRDVDMAKEMMNFSKKNILSQAAQSMLAQANQQPQGVLQLLR